MNKAVILLVEDDKDLMMVTSLQLEEAGYQVYCADNGTRTKAVLQEHKVDLVLLDVMLPDCTGHELCNWIREHYNYPIIFMSCLGDSDTIVQAFREGGDDYLVKPVDIDELNSRIEANLAPKPVPGLRVYKQFIVDTNQHDVYQHLEDGSQGERIELSPTEYKLLLCFAHNLNKIVCIDQLFPEVYPRSEVKYTSRALNMHISNLRHKLKLEEFAPLRLETRRGKGFGMFYNQPVKDNLPGGEQDA